MEKGIAKGETNIENQRLIEAQEFVNSALSALSDYPPTDYASDTVDFFMGIIMDRLNDSVLFGFNGHVFEEGRFCLKPTALPNTVMSATFTPIDGDGTEYINLSKSTAETLLSGGIPVISDTFQLQYNYLAEDKDGNMHNVCYQVQVNKDDADENFVLFFDEDFKKTTGDAVGKNLMLNSRETREKMEFNPDEYSISVWLARYDCVFAKFDSHMDVDDWVTMTNEDVTQGKIIPLPESAM